MLKKIVVSTSNHIKHFLNRHAIFDFPISFLSGIGTLVTNALRALSRPSVITGVSVASVITATLPAVGPTALTMWALSSILSIEIFRGIRKAHAKALFKSISEHHVNTTFNKFTWGFGERGKKMDLKISLKEESPLSSSPLVRYGYDSQKSWPSYCNLWRGRKTLVPFTQAFNEYQIGRELARQEQKAKNAHAKIKNVLSV